MPCRSGAFLRWKQDGLREALSRLRWVAVLCIVAAAAIVGSFGPGSLGAAAGLFLALWLVAGAVAILTTRAQLFRAPWRRSLELAVRTPGSVLGMALAHAGLGLLVAGITCVTAWQQESVKSVFEGENVSIGGYEVQLTGVSTATKDNYQYEIAAFIGHARWQAGYRHDLGAAVLSGQRNRDHRGGNFGPGPDEPVSCAWRTG